ncbi:hypothetical protein GPALN_015638 [Globodera pallida]|nr:hypothetical protein GPALN_015638 [Globodera pallida]
MTHAHRGLKKDIAKMLAQLQNALRVKIKAYVDGLWTGPEGLWKKEGPKYQMRVNYLVRQLEREWKRQHAPQNFGAIVKYAVVALDVGTMAVAEEFGPSRTIGQQPQHSGSAKEVEEAIRLLQETIRTFQTTMGTAGEKLEKLIPPVLTGGNSEPLGRRRRQGRKREKSSSSSHSNSSCPEHCCKKRRNH